VKDVKRAGLVASLSALMIAAAGAGISGCQPHDETPVATGSVSAAAQATLPPPTKEQSAKAVSTLKDMTPAQRQAYVRQNPQEIGRIMSSGDPATKAQIMSMMSQH